MGKNFKTIIFCLVIVLLATGARASTIIKIDSDGRMVGDGMTLYYYINDGNTMISTCTGSCENTWRPFYADDIIVQGDLKSSDFATLVREDGKKQTAYKKWPLYRYGGDRNPGDVNGAGKKDGPWFVVKPKSAQFA